MSEKTVGRPVDWERERKIERRKEIDAQDIARGVFGVAKPGPKAEADMTVGDKLGRAIGANRERR